MPILVEYAADALIAVLGTMSFWARRAPRQREALIAENHAIHLRPCATLTRAFEFEAAGT